MYIPQIAVLEDAVEHTTRCSSFFGRIWFEGDERYLHISVGDQVARFSTSSPIDSTILISLALRSRQLARGVTERTWTSCAQTAAPRPFGLPIVFAPPFTEGKKKPYVGEVSDPSRLKDKQSQARKEKTR